MLRTQIQLPEEQAAVLKKMAAADNKSMAEIIRQSIDFFVKSKSPDGDTQRRKRAIAAAGRFRSGIKDLSALHDDYLAEDFGK
ncbi:MAG TPA: ribbon-helix-helix protein, CopG family [Smithellaceae bacterium]|nr:ribbon-helix-helix protein, CopG family [Smithellaceae bacterium]